MSIQIDVGTAECRERDMMEEKETSPSLVPPFPFGVRFAAGVPIVLPSAGISSVPSCRTM